MPFCIVYVWEDLDASAATGQPEQKFGDHFSNKETLDQAFEETQKYIRGTLGRQKHKFDHGRVVIHAMWDASEYAKLKNRFGPHMKVDDLIRPCIGRHLQADVHLIDHEPLIINVNRELAKHNQPLRNAALSTKQYEVACEVVDKFNKDDNVILAALCARFGKTIWSGAVSVEMDVQLTVIASYVKTVFTSFATDLTSFEQFAGHEHIDTADANYQQKINDALAEGKRVFAYLSLANGSQRQNRIDFLFDLNVTKMLIVDEADFGAHQIKQAQPLVDKLPNIDYTIIMTGTNADRAVTHWPVSSVVSVTYPELLIQKKISENA